MLEKNCFKINFIGCYEGFCKMEVIYNNQTYEIMKLFHNNLYISGINGTPVTQSLAVENSPLANFEDRIKREIVKEQM